MSEADIATVICELLTNVVACPAPLKFTVPPDTNPTPFTVSVNAAEPAAALEGEIELSVGTGLLIANDTAFDVPLGAGFVTVTVAVPAVAISAAVIAAVNCVALTKVVVLAAPLNFTTDVETKAVPLTVSAKSAPPAVALVGEREVALGAGLLTVNV